MLALQNAVDHLKRAAAAADAVLAPRGQARPGDPGADRRRPRPIDQLLLDPQGLPGRPWYKNMVYAPGTLTGYGAKTLPGVREAIEQRRLDDARDLCRAHRRRARGLCQPPRPGRGDGADDAMSAGA